MKESFKFPVVYVNWQAVGLDTSCSATFANFFEKMTTFRQLFYNFGEIIKEFSRNLCLSLAGSGFDHSLIYFKFVIPVTTKIRWINMKI